LRRLIGESSTGDGDSPTSGPIRGDSVLASATAAAAAAFFSGVASGGVVAATDGGGAAAGVSDAAPWMETTAGCGSAMSSLFFSSGRWMPTSNE
jgi:hypothetical protein